MRIKACLFMVLMSFVGLAASGCSAEDLVEEAVERQIEAESGGDVEIDIDEGGSEVSIRTEDGDASFSSGGERPEDWPDFLDDPEGFEVVGAVVIDEGGTKNMSLTLEGSGDIEAAVAHYEGILADWAVLTETDMSDSSGRTLYRQFEQGTRQVSVFASDYDGASSLQVNVLEEQAESGENAAAGDDSSGSNGSGEDPSFDGVENSARTLGLDEDDAAQLDEAVSQLSPETRYGIVLDQLSVEGRVEADGNTVSLVFDVPESEGDFMTCILAGVLAEDGEIVQAVYTDTTVEC